MIIFLLILLGGPKTWATNSRQLNHYKQHTVTYYYENKGQKKKGCFVMFENGH